MQEPGLLAADIGGVMDKTLVVTKEQIAEEIRQEHHLCVESINKGMEHALKVGELLVQAKELVKHGN